MSTPYRYVTLASPLFRRMRRVVRNVSYTGSGVHCVLCDRSFRAWLERGRAQAVCPNCDCEPRHRLMWLFIERHMRELLHEGREVLHIAPHHSVRWRFQRLPLGSYVSADLSAPDADVHTDITDMSFDDASFDVVLCSHVLEHIPDDRTAMAEIRRVLRPGGCALIMVPYARKRLTDEDPDVEDPAERERRWGQFDHVRIYGTDFAARLAESGLDVEEVRLWKELSPAARAHFGLIDDSLFACTRPILARDDLVPQAELSLGPTWTDATLRADGAS